MTSAPLTMSRKELERAEWRLRVHEQRMTQLEAAERLGLSVRRVERLYREYKVDGAAALVSKKRGRSSTRQGHLAAPAAGEPLHAAERRDGDLDAFLRGLSTAWHDGEVRPTHRARPKAQRDWRTRKDPFEAVWPSVLAWLQQEPDRTAKELLLRLQADHPGSIPIQTFEHSNAGSSCGAEQPHGSSCSRGTSSTSPDAA